MSLLCTKCKKEPQGGGPGSHASWCLKCRAKQQRDWRKTPAGKAAKERRRWRFILKQYGITEKEYNALYHSQSGRCAICQTPETETEGQRLQVDHCHKSGDVRGLLCAKCNRGIGNFNDDPQRLIAAQEYLA